jgi:lysophospholipase L1-like esterase
VGSPYGAPNQTVAETWLRAGATTTHETPGTARIVTVEGQAGQALALDGYSATGGVIDGGAAATARAAFVTRITNYVTSYSLGSASLVLWFMMGTNDMGAGTLSSNFQVALDQWVTDMRSIAAINTCPIVIQSITRRTAYEGTTAPGYRTAANTVASARSLTYVNGLTIYADGDLSDGVHAKITAQPQHVTQIMSTLTSLGRASTGHVLLYGDSIANGSAGTPQDWAAARGLPMLLKQARAAA